MGIGRGGKGEWSRLETGGKKNGWWWWRWINCWTRQDKRRADTERGGIEREVSRVTGRWTVKRWSGALQHARGQSNKRAAVKNQYLLINFPTLLACKKPVEQCLYWHSSPPSLYRSFQTRGPNRERCDQSGRLDGGQIGGKRAPVLAAASGSHVDWGQEELNRCHFFRNKRRGFCFWCDDSVSELREATAAVRGRKGGSRFWPSDRRNE